MEPRTANVNTAPQSEAARLFVDPDRSREAQWLAEDLRQCARAQRFAEPHGQHSAKSIWPFVLPIGAIAALFFAAWIV